MQTIACKVATGGGFTFKSVALDDFAGLLNVDERVALHSAEALIPAELLGED